MRATSEQRALGLVEEAVGHAEGVLLADAGEAERLAGKPGKQHVVVGDLARGDAGDVAVELVAVPEVGPVRLLGVPVPLAAEHAAASDGLETDAQPADPREQVDEPEDVAPRVHDALPCVTRPSGPPEGPATVNVRRVHLRRFRVPDQCSPPATPALRRGQERESRRRRANAMRHTWNDTTRPESPLQETGRAVACRLRTGHPVYRACTRRDRIRNP
jgi:hypothetical protein